MSQGPNTPSGAQHVQSHLMRESLVDKNVIARTESQVTAILPARFPRLAYQFKW